jgi:hypothetical protein
VVIVNESFARTAWPGEDPLGKEVRHDLVLFPDDVGVRRVVGVVSDFRYYGLEREPEPQMYVPHAQSPWPAMHLLIRATSDPVSLQTEVRRILRADADVPRRSHPRLIICRRRYGAAVCGRLLTGFAVASPPCSRRSGLRGRVVFRSLRIGRRPGSPSARQLRVGSEVVTLVVGQALRSRRGAASGALGAASLGMVPSSLLFSGF